MRQALDLPASAPVTVGEWGRLTTLSADSNQVQSLGGLQYAVNLQSLTLVPNDFSKPGWLTDSSSFHTQLANLSKLKSLTLQDCGLDGSELTTLALGGLTSLTSLDLRYNAIQTVLPAIANIPTLTNLYLYGNPLNTAPVSATNPTPQWCVSLAGKLLTVDIAPQDTTKIIENIVPAGPTAATTTATFRALAAAFYNLPIEIYQYLVNTIQYQPYNGAMKGPLAVLQTGAGNDWDTDSLLVALFEAAGLSGKPELRLGPGHARSRGDRKLAGGYRPYRGRRRVAVGGLAAGDLYLRQRERCQPRIPAHLGAVYDHASRCDGADHLQSRPVLEAVRLSDWGRRAARSHEAANYVEFGNASNSSDLNPMDNGYVNRRRARPRPSRASPRRNTMNRWSAPSFRAAARRSRTFHTRVRSNRRAFRHCLRRSPSQARRTLPERRPRSRQALTATSTGSA